METKKQLRATIADLVERRRNLATALDSSDRRIDDLSRELGETKSHLAQQTKRATEIIEHLKRRTNEIAAERGEALEAARSSNAENERLRIELEKAERAARITQRTAKAANKVIANLRAQLEQAEPAEPVNEIVALFDGSEALTAAEISKRLGRRVSWQELKANNAIRAVKGSRPKQYYHHKLPKT